MKLKEKETEFSIVKYLCIFTIHLVKKKEEEEEGKKPSRVLLYDLLPFLLLLLPK